jgi:hypothetical protein
MSSTRMSLLRRWNWRILVFAIVVGLLVLYLLYTGAPALLAPWVLFPRWYLAEIGALSCILGCGSLLALLWKPGEKPLLAQFLVVAFVIFILINLIFFLSHFTVLLLAAIVLMGLFVITYPLPRSLVSFSREGSPSILLVLLSLWVAILLEPMALYDLTQQIKAPISAFATDGDWIYSAMLAFVLVVGGLLSAMKRPGWTWLGIIIGIAFLYLGVVAIAVPHSPGSWGTTGGILSVLGGLAYFSFTYYEMRNMAKRPADPVPPPVSPQE